MLNRKLIALVSLICVVALALPAFAHEDTAFHGQQGSRRIEECRPQSSLSVNGHGSSEKRGYGSNTAKVHETEMTAFQKGGRRDGRNGTGSHEDRRYYGQDGMGRQNRVSDQSMESRNMGKGDLHNGPSTRAGGSDLKVHQSIGQGARDGSGRDRQDVNGQGMKWGPRDGSGPGTGFKDGLHRNRK